MKQSLLALVAVILVAAAFILGRQQGLREGLAQAPVAPAAALAQASVQLPGESCDGREFCAVAYLAPWCPHCKSAVPDLVKMEARARDPKAPGLKILVGAGKPAENKKMAALFGKAGVEDPSGASAQALSVAYYPTFVVLDAKGLVVQRDEQALHWMQQNLL